MNALPRLLPAAITLAAALGLLVHGPIAQWPDYHAFADQALLLGIPRGADVLSNLGFALVAAWGWLRGDPRRLSPGHRLFLASLFLTALGSAFYHLAPDNHRLLWDRLPIALACAGLLAGVRADLGIAAEARLETAALAAVALASVLWWYLTELEGAGDLRPYLLLQTLPLVLIPLWQWLYRAPPAERAWMGAALACYVLAKAAELNDHALLAATGWISGHTLKHLLATLAAALIVARLARRG